MKSADNANGGVRDTDEIPALESASARRGRLFKLRLQRSRAAREDALASVRQLPNGRWQARIGGRMRGKTVQFASRDLAQHAVHTHYDLAMLAFVKENRR